MNANVCLCCLKVEDLWLHVDSVDMLTVKIHDTKRLVCASSSYISVIGVYTESGEPQSQQAIVIHVATQPRGKMMI